MVTTSRWRLGLRERIQGILWGMVELNPASIFLNLRHVIDCTRVCTTSSIPDEVGHPCPALDVHILKVAQTRIYVAHTTMK
jgi:hypothetical protein